MYRLRFLDQQEADQVEGLLNVRPVRVKAQSAYPDNAYIAIPFPSTSSVNLQLLQTHASVDLMTGFMLYYLYSLWFLML